MALHEVSALGLWTITCRHGHRETVALAPGRDPVSERTPCPVCGALTCSATRRRRGDRRGER